MRGVSLAYEAGGPDINVQPQILRLRKLLEKHCNGPYSDEVKGFALILRIDGSPKQYGAEGVDRMRRRKKEEYITADICIPGRRWKGVSADGVLPLPGHGRPGCTQNLRRLLEETRS
jgi:hypothetical protein